jgi:hypothetical protein
MNVDFKFYINELKVHDIRKKNICLQCLQNPVYIPCSLEYHLVLQKIVMSICLIWVLRPLCYYSFPPSLFKFRNNTFLLQIHCATAEYFKTFSVLYVCQFML